MRKNEYIFGRRSVIEALESGKELDKVFIRRDLSGDLAKELLDKLKKTDVPVQRVPVEKLNKLTRLNHQGVVALISTVEYYTLSSLLPQLYEEGKIPFLIVLDGITDTRNFGAIARTAECAGADAIVIPMQNSAGVTAEAVKTSAGALLHLPVCRVRNIKECLSELHQNGYKIIGASEKSKENYTDVNYNDPVAIVLGGEDKGLSSDTLRMCDNLVSIPIMGNISSLNVSVAAGVMMYEVVRQRLEEYSYE